MGIYWLASSIVILTEWLMFAHAHDCSSNESEVCREELDNLMWKGKRHSYLNDERHIDDVCRKQLNAVQCVKTFAESCLPANEQDLFKTLTSGSDDFFYHFCSADSLMRQDYLKNSACLKSVSPKIDECSKQYEESQKYLEEHVTDTEILKKETCCIYFENIRCSSNATDETCGEEAAEVVTKLWILLSGTYLIKMCEPFKEYFSDGCTPVSKGYRSTEKVHVLNVLFLVLYTALTHHLT